MLLSGQWISTFKSDIYQGELCSSLEEVPDVSVSFYPFI